jgi:DNA replication initiation complex subunit (GINS family)
VREDEMVNYSDLRDIQKREMESSAIVGLPDDFYDSVSALLSAKKRDALSSSSMLAIKEYENIKKILLSIQAKREEKIVLMAVRGENAGAGLTPPEREMLRELVGTVARSRDAIRAVWSNDEAQPGSSRRLRLLADVTQYKGLDNAVYGPFRKGEECTLPPPEAEWLLKSRMAELL